jgi:hypothetical protein
MISRDLGPRSPHCRVLFRDCRWCARKGARHGAVHEERSPSIELQDPSCDTAGFSSAHAVNWQGPMRNCQNGCRGEEGSYYLSPSVGIELADMEPDVVSCSVRLDALAVVLKRNNAPGD